MRSQIAVAVAAGVLAGASVVVAVVAIPDDTRRKPQPVPTETVYVENYTTRVRPGPRPTVTVTVTRPAVVSNPASRSMPRQPSSSPSAGRVLNRSDEAFLRCVVKRESGGNPTAQNPYSSASGLFQFIDGTWRSVTRKSGIGTQYARAKHAPAAVQWAVARWTVENVGRGPWRATVPGTGC